MLHEPAVVVSVAPVTSSAPEPAVRSRALKATGVSAPAPHAPAGNGGNGICNCSACTLKSTSVAKAVVMCDAAPAIPLAAPDATPGFWGWRPLYYSTFHSRWIGISGGVRLLLAYQHIRTCKLVSPNLLFSSYELSYCVPPCPTMAVYYPLMAIARFNLYAQSWIMLLARKNTRQRYMEMAFLALFAVWHAALLIIALPNWSARLQYLLLSHAVAGILHIQITLSHFAMDVYHGTRLQKVPARCFPTCLRCRGLLPCFCSSCFMYAMRFHRIFVVYLCSQFEDWCTNQLLTTMNVDSNGFTHWFHGGMSLAVLCPLFFCIFIWRLFLIV